MTEIRVRELCPRCQGAGVVQHPAWADFWAALGPAGELSGERVEAWFGHRGYGPHEIPPEESDCPDCDGDGHVYRWLSLTDLPSGILALVAPPRSGEEG